MTLVLDWLFGGDPPGIPGDRWLNEPNERGPDAAPILKLTSAIVSQAVSDRASRIELWTGVPAFEYQTCETPEAYERRKGLENLQDIEMHRKVTSGQFARVMAEAGIRQGKPRAEDPLSWLTVIYQIGGFRFAAMTIPANLVDPCIRTYPFYFNYNRCTTVARPENLVYVQTKLRAAFASIDHYDRSSDYKVGIALEYEE